MALRQRLLLIAPCKMTHSPAFERAAALAGAMDASLSIVAFAYFETMETFNLLDTQGREAVRESRLKLFHNWLDIETAQLRQQGLETSFEIICAPRSAIEICRYISVSNVDFVLKDLYAESAARPLSLSELDWQLLRGSPAPVLLVTDARHPHPRKILAAVDILHEDPHVQQLNDSIIETAGRLARACHACLHLLSVYDRSVQPLADVDEQHAATTPSYEEEEALFNALADKYAIDEEHRHFIAGAAANVINAYVARCNYDILVMGTANHRPLDMLLGRTADIVLDHPPCNVLVLKPFAVGRPNDQDESATTSTALSMKK